MNPIIAVEGVSFAGKTTLTKFLEKEGFSRLYELAEKFGYGAGFPHFPESTEAAKQSDHWFVQQEVIREQDALVKATCYPVIADRSFISGLAFSYARKSVFGLGDPNYQHGVVKEAISEGKLHIPWLIYLKIDLDSLFQRKEKDNARRIKEYGAAAVANATIASDEQLFFEKQREFYARLFANVPHLELDALQRTQDLAIQVRTWSRRLPLQFQTIALDDLLIKPKVEL